MSAGSGESPRRLGPGPVAAQAEDGGLSMGLHRQGADAGDPGHRTADRLHGSGPSRRPVDGFKRQRFIDARAANCTGLLKDGNCAGDPFWMPPDGDWWTWPGIGGPPTNRSGGTIMNQAAPGNPGGYDFAGSRGMLDAGQRLRDRIEGAFPVPEHLRNTGSVRSAQGWGGLVPVAATGALGLARSASAKAGAALASGAVGAGQASRDLARRGAGSAEQRIGAFVGAVSEGLGPQGTRIAAKQGANLLKTHLGLDLTTLATSEMKVLNDILAPRGLKVALDGAVRTISGKAHEGPTVRR